MLRASTDWEAKYPPRAWRAMMTPATIHGVKLLEPESPPKRFPRSFLLEDLSTMISACLTWVCTMLAVVRLKPQAVQTTASAFMGRRQPGQEVADLAMESSMRFAMMLGSPWGLGAAPPFCGPAAGLEPAAAAAFFLSMQSWH